MSLETVITWGTFLISLVAIGISLRKSKAEVRNLDADTIADLQGSLNRALADYENILCRVKDMRKEVDEIREENKKLMATVRNLEVHIRALVAQLLKAGITPVTMEQALEDWKRGNNV